MASMHQTKRPVFSFFFLDIKRKKLVDDTRKFVTDYRPGDLASDVKNLCLELGKLGKTPYHDVWA